MADVLVSIEQAIQRVDKEIQHLVELRSHLRRTLRAYGGEMERNAQSLTNEVIALRIVDGAGQEGITLKELDERLRGLGFDIERKTISSYLTRAKKRGKVHKYYKRWWTARYWEQFNLESKEEAIEQA